MHHFRALRLAETLQRLEVGCTRLFETLWRSLMVSRGGRCERAQNIDFNPNMLSTQNGFRTHRRPGYPDIFSCTLHETSFIVQPSAIPRNPLLRSVQSITRRYREKHFYGSVLAAVFDCTRCANTRGLR